MKKSIIKVRNIFKSYSNIKTDQPVLNDISFDIYEGEFLSISGPSGCGKSTLLNILGLLDTPDKGQYFVKDTLTQDLNDRSLSKLRAKEIGFVFQSFNLIDEMSVLDNIALPLKCSGVDLNQRQARARECLELIGLPDKSDYRASSAFRGAAAASGCCQSARNRLRCVVSG